MLVEADIIKMQKDAVEMTRSLLQTYLKSETTESGNMNWEFTAKDSDYEIKVNADIEKYINIISYLQGKQEFWAKWKVRIDSSGKRFDQGSEPTKNADGSYTYPKNNWNLAATIDFDLNVKLIGNDVYFTISEFKIERSGTDGEVKAFDEVLRETQRYVGVTYKVPGSYANFENPTWFIKQMEAVFQVLERASLFEVESSKGDTHRLRVKKSTIQAINLALGRKKNASMNQMMLDSKKMGFTYQKTTTGGIFKLTERKNKQNYMQISSINGEYSMDMVSSEVNRRLKTQEYIQMQMSRDSMTMKTALIDSYSSNWIDLTWKNNQLNAKFTNSVNAQTTTYEAQGVLDIWTGNMDLKFMQNSKEFGNLVIKSWENNVDFSVNFTFDSILGIEQFRLSGEGSAQTSKTAQEIKTPVTFETIN